MSLSNEELSGLVEKYPPIMRFTLGEDSDHIIFHLTGDKEIAVSIQESNGKHAKFEGLGQFRNKNQRGFGDATCILKESTKIELVKSILDNLLDYYFKSQNK